MPKMVVLIKAKSEKKETNHINYPDSKGCVFCKAENEVVDWSQKFFGKHCFKCPLLAGNVGGKGIECCYADGSGAESKTYKNADKAEEELKNV